MGLLQTVLTDEEPGVPRWRTWARTVAKQPGQLLALTKSLRGWSEKGIIALVMQPVDNSLTVYAKRTKLGRWKLTSKQGPGEPNPAWIPAGNEVVRRWRSSTVCPAATWAT